MEQLLGQKLAGETEVLVENLPHKSHVTWSGIESGPPQWETGEKYFI
jgi:hypothetical protein